MPPPDRSQLLKLARAGAEVRLAELKSEIDFIYRSFPDLQQARRGGARRAQAAETPTEQSVGERGWTAAQRKAAAERMRKYWAARKAAKK
jgi:hypothetical protein